MKHVGGKQTEWLLSAKQRSAKCGSKSDDERLFLARQAPLAGRCIRPQSALPYREHASSFQCQGEADAFGTVPVSCRSDFDTELRGLIRICAGGRVESDQRPVRSPALDMRKGTSNLDLEYRRAAP